MNTTELTGNIVLMGDCGLLSRYTSCMQPLLQLKTEPRFGPINKTVCRGMSLTKFHFLFHFVIFVLIIGQEKFQHIAYNYEQTIRLK